MITEFLDSWALFHDTYLAGWLIGVLLAIVGVLVVARDQIFIGAAVSEASALGIALGLSLAAARPLQDVGWLAEWLESDACLSILASLASVLAALATARGGGAGRESTEAVTGWVFLLAASLSILIVSHSPHGMEEVHRLLLSSIIGASAADVGVFAVLAALAGGGVLVLRRRLLLIITDEEMAAAVGIRTRAWNVALSCLLGLAVGMSLRASGMLFTFGSLVLPALAARNLTRSALRVFLIAPLVSAGANTAAFVLANHSDQPPGQMAVALLCAVVAAASVVRRLRRA